MRRKFLVGIFGALGLAKAQQQPDGNGQPDARSATVEQPGRWLVKNGQCPVCGTMAPAWHNPPLCMGMPDGLQGAYKPMPCGPNEKVTRCARCSNAFYQDAE